MSGVVEDTETGRPVFFGMTAWTKPASVAGVIAGVPKLFRNALLRMEGSRKPLFLSPKQLPAANGAGDLALVHLAGCPEEKDFTQPRGFESHRLAFQ